jgi:putative DNA-invertase from lambdoid prophage Rac
VLLCYHDDPVLLGVIVMLYGYGRVSTDMQGCSADDQRLQLQTWAGDREIILCIDEDVSGSIPLKERPQGKAMWDLLVPGDVVVVTTKDRAFRSLIDAANTLLTWSQLGIKLHIMDFPVDLTTDEGEMAFLTGAVFAQYERKKIGKRTSSALQHKARTGQPYLRTRPWGWLRQGKEYVPCDQERKLGLRMLAMRQAGMSCSAIAIACMDCRKPQSRKGHWYTDQDVRKIVRAAEAGYPRLAQSAWLARDCEQRLAAVICHGPPKSS